MGVSIGSVTLSYELIGLIGVSIVALGLLAWNIRLEVRLSKMRYGKNAERLDESMSNIHTHLDSLEKTKQAIIDHLTSVEERLKKSVQSIETVRFNPFQGTGSGGNQSFASAFLNENGDGVILSSLYSRDRVSVFSKPLNAFESSYDLSEEEKKVVTDAKQKLSRK